MRRWDGDKKQRILDSRVQGTAAVVAALAALKTPPRVLVCASAVGYYGFNSGDQVYTKAVQTVLLRSRTAARKVFSMTCGGGGAGSLEKHRRRVCLCAAAPLGTMASALVIRYS
jgi:hypothetical protein